MIDAERVGEMLILFLMEHTACSRREVVRFLDAEGDFWATHLDLYTQFMEEEAD